MTAPPNVTPEQWRLAEAAARVLREDASVAAVWLAGSLGRGAGDAFSDVDLLVLVTGASATEAGLRYVDKAAEIAAPALVNTLLGGRVISVVTEDWRRFDLSFVEISELERHDAARLIELFNRSGVTPPRRNEEPYSPSGATVLGLVNEFLRVMGLSVVAVGREEWLLAQWGADILRRLTMDLMLEENGVSPAERGGALRRRPLLTADQFDALVSLSPVTPDLQGMLTSNRELAAIFLPRARALAERVGATWPSRFEHVTRDHLRSRLGLELA
jgi:predicted nucleotidyltransferase